MLLLKWNIRNRKVCKKKNQNKCLVWIENSIPRNHCFASLGKTSWCKTVTLRTEFSICTLHPCKILIICSMMMYRETYLSLCSKILSIHESSFTRSSRCFLLKCQNLTSPALPAVIVTWLRPSTATPWTWLVWAEMFAKVFYRTLVINGLKFHFTSLHLSIMIVTCWLIMTTPGINSYSLDLN